MNTLPYVDGFVIPVPTANLEQYRAVAEKAAEIWTDHGALEYHECVADDLSAPDMRPFTESAAAREDETVVLAFVIYPSREVRDAANEAIMKDPRITGLCSATNGIFDCKRMSYGGFRSIVRMLGGASQAPSVGS